MFSRKTPNDFEDQFFKTWLFQHPVKKAGASMTNLPAGFSQI
jgi:hypothetical protein